MGSNGQALGIEEGSKLRYRGGRIWLFNWAGELSSAANNTTRASRYLKPTVPSSLQNRADYRKTVHLCDVQTFMGEACAARPDPCAIRQVQYSTRVHD